MAADQPRVIEVLWPEPPPYYCDARSLDIVSDVGSNDTHLGACFQQPVEFGCSDAAGADDDNGAT